jgi:two-component system, LytTR family, sensor kinase
MKKQLSAVILWTFVFYYIYSPLQDAALKGDPSELYIFLVDGFEAILTVTTLIPFTCYSIGAYLVFYYTYNRSPIWVSIIGCILMALLVIGLRYFLQEMCLRWLFGFGNYRDGYPIPAYITDNLYYAFLFSCFGAVLYFVQYARFSREREQKLEIENQHMQLSLLRAQINPHFLFNAMNGIYSLVNEKSPKALSAIETLSKALRYSLYEQDGMVPLKREWAFVQDYLRLQEMRLPYQPALLVDVPDPLPEIELPPFILTNFIENAFKHGELASFDHPVRIRMETTEEAFVFCVSNVIKKQEKDQTGGLGLENTRQRLLLVYGDRHDLHIATTPDNRFLVTLSIDIDACSVA